MELYEILNRIFEIGGKLFSLCAPQNNDRSVVDYEVQFTVGQRDYFMEYVEPMQDDLEVVWNVWEMHDCKTEPTRFSEYITALLKGHKRDDAGNLTAP